MKEQEMCIRDSPMTVTVVCKLQDNAAEILNKSMTYEESDATVGKITVAIPTIEGYTAVSTTAQELDFTAGATETVTYIYKVAG